MDDRAEIQAEAREAAMRARAGLLDLAMALAVEVVEAARAMDGRTRVLHLDDDIEVEGQTWSVEAWWQREGDEVVVRGRLVTPDVVVGPDEMAAALGAQQAAFGFSLPTSWLMAAHGARSRFDDVGLDG